MKTIKNLNFVWVVLFLFNLPTTIGGSKTSNLYAQDPLLFDNSWFVKNHTISAQTTQAPSLPEMTIQVFFGSNEVFHEMCCGGQMELQVTFDNPSSSFEVNEVGISLDECNDASLNTFRDLFVDFFANNTSGSFEYTIDEVSANIGNYLTLTITNLEGAILELFNMPQDLLVDFYIFEETTTWFLTGIIMNGSSHPISYETASQTSATFSIDGNFNSLICGEFSAKSAFINDDGGNEFGSGDFYIPCEDFTFTSGNCSDSDLIALEQHYLAFLQNLAFGNVAQYQRGHVDFTDICGVIEFIEIFDPTTNSYLFFSDCLEPLSIETFDRNFLTIFPNPVQETLHINQTNYQYSFAIIYDLQGKNLGQHLLENSKSTIDVKSFIAGLYFLVLESEKGERVTQKLVKK